MENGTNQRNIFQLIYFLNTTIREAELVKVPIVKEKGTKDAGKSRLSMGIKIKLAPPPQIALIQNAKIVPKKSKIIFKVIFFIDNAEVGKTVFQNKYNQTLVEGQKKFV